MHNVDIEKLYSKINGRILLVMDYWQDPYLKNIIRSCRLKPYSVFINGIERETKLEAHWVDEFGNSLKLGKPHQVILNDTSVDGTKTSSDLFFGCSINETIKNTKAVFLSEAKYMNKDIVVAALYCNDEYLRAYYFADGWLRLSPLLLGLSTLKEIFKNIDKYGITEIDNKKLDFVLRFDASKSIMSAQYAKIIDYFNNQTITNIFKG